MNIYLKKFGTTLNSRQAGLEAYTAIKKSLEEISNTEEVVIDFAEVDSFSPSWLDEFLSPILDKFNDKMILINTSGNISATITLKSLERLNKVKYNISS